MTHTKVLVLSALFAIFGATQAAYAQDDCPNRGDLDTMYCDANNDLVADTPTDPDKLKTPSTVVFTYTPVEDPAVSAEIYIGNALWRERVCQNVEISVVAGTLTTKTTHKHQN